MPDACLIHTFLATEKCQIQLEPGRDVMIRRGDDASTLWLCDPAISRDPAGAARLSASGRSVMLVPAESTPVLINGMRIREPAPLAAGDRVRIGSSILIVQSIALAEEEETAGIETLVLKTAYVREREQIVAEADRLAQWAEGLDQLRLAASDAEAAEVIMRHVARLAPAERVLIAQRERGSGPRASRELAACGLSSGEVEEILQWLARTRLEAGVVAPDIAEVRGAQSLTRAACGVVPMPHDEWLVYLEPSLPPGGLPAAQRALLVLSNLLQLYHALHEHRSGRRVAEQLSATVRAYSRPLAEALCQKVESRFVFQGGLMRGVCRQLARAAMVDSPVLILGERGTGKQLAAEAIHAASPRAHRPMTTVNLAECSENLVEAELFGTVKGAFTGAVNRPGLIAQAEGGTLFLDELGEVPVNVQAKLLRVLEMGEYRRVGDYQLRSANVRLICATNRDLAQDVARGAFRADLFDRVNVIPIVLPPLRDRPDDIAVLAQHFLRHFNQKASRAVRLGEEGLRHLRRYAWPENVRGLKNYIERLVVMTPRDGTPLDPDEMPPLGQPAAPPLCDRGVINSLIEELRRGGRWNQARLLEAMGATTARMTKKDWSRQLQVSLPVLRAELRQLVAFALRAGLEMKFFESRVALRPEDMREIEQLNAGRGGAQ
jgi:DNA-binding NtrC family response regulator